MLAIDVGGSSFKGAVVDGGGCIRERVTMPVLGRQGEAGVALLFDLADRLAALAGASGLLACAAGVIAPGMDEASGRVMFAANLGWRELALRDRLQARLGLPVAAGHDVRSAGLAEHRLGAARGFADAALVMLGTGIAAALVSDGRMLAGHASMAGELGHIPVFPDGERCPCGQRGCLEAYASAGGIARRYLALGGVAGRSVAQLVATRAHDPAAAQVWREAIEALSLGLATLTLLLDPAVIVLGGGLAAAGGLFEPLGAALAGRLAWRPAPQLRPSLLGADGALLGAAILGFRAAGAADLVDAWKTGK